RERGSRLATVRRLPPDAPRMSGRVGFSLALILADGQVFKSFNPLLKAVLAARLAKSVPSHPHSQLVAADVGILRAILSLGSEQRRGSADVDGLRLPILVVSSHHLPCHVSDS